MSQATYETFKKEMSKLADIDHTIAVLNWDKEVNLPKKGASFRGQQISTLAGIRHELFTSQHMEELLQTLSEVQDLDASQARNVLLVKKAFDRNKKLPQEFVIRNSKTIQKTYHAWIQAREANDFAVYRDALTEMVAVRREEAELVGYEDHPYDAMLDLYEPESKTKDLEVLFKNVREKLIAFTQKIRDKQQVRTDFLYQKYNTDVQWQYGLDILAQMGYDFEGGRQDLSPHPFTTTFAPTDVRVTTRVDEDNFNNMLWSCIHEGGHALYEQGLPESQYGMPLGNAIGLGIHESQSRLWENNVGRSLGYWQFNYPSLQKAFPENLDGIDVETFYRGINAVEPSLIRTESDELHYHFHILIRFEIEKGLMEGSIEVKDLDKVWNAKYKEYLGVDVPSDNKGVLQDIHWSHGSLGYFPTYSLGSFYAAQFFEQAKKELPGLEEEIRNGDSSALLTWLREKVHVHGQMYNSEELCKRITGEGLNFDHFMRYAEAKFTFIYGL